MRTGEMTTIGGLLTRRAEEHGSLTAFTFLDDGGAHTRTLTYRELDTAARGVAALAAPLGPGERVLVLTATAAGFVSAFLGCQYAGVIPVPVAQPAPPVARRSATLAAIAHDCDAAAVLSDFPRPDWADNLGRAGRRWLVVGGKDAVGGPDVVFRNLDDIAFLQYTSGSTAVPKGVIVTHRGLMHNHEFYERITGITAQDTVVTWLPLFHDMGLIGQVLQTIHTGCRAVVMPPGAFIRRPSLWLSAVTEHRGTLIGGPNFAYDLCVTRISPADREKFDLRSLRVAYSGAEPIRPETLRAFARAYAPYGFDPLAVLAGYGLAEVTLAASASTLRNGLETLTVDRERLRHGSLVPGGDLELVSCGQDVLHRTTTIVDPETRTRCPDGTVGEIWLSGPDVALGYWDKPGETTDTFGVRITGEQGPAYLRTGDLGVRHDGQLYITGRLKDVLIVSGRNHFPQDIELTVESADERVRKGCVVAFGVELAGVESVVVIAEVVAGRTASTRPDGLPESSDLSDLSEKLRAAIFQEHGLAVEEIVMTRPRTIPKTSSGKLQRRACRAAYFAGELAELHRDVVPR